MYGQVNKGDKMAGRGMFSRLSSAFQGENKKEKTHADLTDELKVEIKAIQETERQSIDAGSLLGQDWSEKDELVFVINLLPMYEMIGGRDGRLAKSLPETCKNEFAESIGEQRAGGTLQGDCFLMKFHDMGYQAGLEEAVKIVNKIGYQTFGKNFGEMEVSELLVAADAAEITANGKLDLAMVKSVIAAGGVDLAFQKPIEIAPQWMKLAWQKITQKQKLAKIATNHEKEVIWESVIPVEGTRGLQLKEKKW
jgi:hypothetical protein